ncbi:MAG: ATP-binding protein [Rhodospirillales bacterium]
MFSQSTCRENKANSLKSLSVQAILIVAGSLIIAYSFSLFVYSKDRLEALVDLGLKNTALTVIHFAHTVAVSEPAWRLSVIDSVDRDEMYVLLADKPAFEQTKYDTKHDIAFDKYLRSGAHGNEFVSLRFSLSQEAAVKNGSGEQQKLTNRPPHLLQVFLKLPMHMIANVAMELESGQWLNISLPLPDYPSELWSPALSSVGVFTIILILVSAFTVRRILRPLTDVTRAVRDFSQNIDAPPMQSGQSAEAIAVAEAFNKMRENIKAIVRSRTEMMGAISHDFRTPLTLIKLRAESLPASTERDRLCDSIDGMEAIVNDSLLFAKQMYGGEAKRKVDLIALLQSVCDDLTEAEQIADFLPPTGRVITKGNPIALRRAFSNLVDNAVKYGEDAKVTMTVNEGHVSIFIEDDGPGIPSDELERVFEPFYRCDRARTKNTGGTGLGLSLAKSVIESHGGKIRLARRQPRGLSAIVQLGLDEN